MLTDADCRNATCPADLKRRRLTDGGGLYLEVSPGGARRWFWKTYANGKEGRLALGSYPAVTLKAARLARDEAKRSKAEGANPVQQRKTARLTRAASSAVTFEAVARELHATKAGAWSENHSAQWLRCLSNDVFPAIGSLPLADITAPILLDPLRKVQTRGALRLAHDLREFAGQVFRYGIATGRCEGNPAADLRGALKARDPIRAARTLEGLRGEAAAPPLVLWALASEARGEAANARMPALLHAAKIDRMIKGLARGDVWDEFLQLALRLTRSRNS